MKRITVSVYVCQACDPVNYIIITMAPPRLSAAGRASHAAQPAAPAAQPAAVRALQEGAARRPQPTPPPTHHQRHGAGGAEQRHGKFACAHYHRLALFRQFESARDKNRV